MPFGLINAGATFQRFVDHVLQGMPNVIAYIDDLIVFSASEEEHKRHLEELFKRLNQFGLVINPTKSEFGLQKLKFLGHLVTPEGILPLSERVKAIQNYSTPKTIKQLRAFLGLINYYHRFVKSMAKCLAPLYELLKGPNKRKNDLINWNEEATEAFHRSKTLLSNATLLVYPHSNLPTNILVDASNTAIGAVLQQQHASEWKPVAFFSRKLDAAQKRYSTFDRELFAAYKSLHHFHFLIDGIKFALLTDHKPLVAAFYSKKDQIIARRARQLSFISEFTNDVRHVQGNQNVVADTLSRLEINNLVFSQDALDYSEIAKAQQEDEYIKKLLNQSVETGMKLKEYPIEESNLTLLCDISTTKVRPILPVKFQKIVFHKIHDLSHPGIKVSKDLIQQRFVWYGMKKDITNWVKTCLTCQKGKVLKHNKAPLQRFTLPSTRFSEAHADIVGPLPPSCGYRYILTVIDRFSRWVTATPMKEITAEATSEGFLQGWVQYYGVPHTITTDRGSQFTSQTWSNLMCFLGTKHITTTSYHPQSNGIVEVVRRRLKDALRMQNSPSNWNRNLPLVLLSIRTSIKEELQCSPAELVYGQTLRLPQDCPIPSSNGVEPGQFVAQLKKHFKQIKAPPTREHFNKHFLDSKLQSCKRVFVRNDHQQQPWELRYKGPFKVVKRRPKYFVVLEKGKERTISIDRVKACQDADDPAPDENETDDQQKNDIVIQTRCGRVVNKPFRFRNYYE